MLQRSVIVVNRGSDRYILLVKKEQCAFLQLKVSLFIQF